MKARVRIPVNITVSSAHALLSPTLEEVEKHLAAQTAKYWLLAQRELQADGHDHVPRVAGVTWSWIGTGRRAFSELERRGIEKRLRAVIDRSTTEMLPPPKPRPPGKWEIEEWEFQVRFDKFLAVLATLHPDHAQAHEARHAGHLKDNVDGVVWVARTLQAAAFASLVAEIDRRRAKEFGYKAPSFYVWDHQRTEQVRALDPANLRGLPRLADTDLPAAPADMKTWIVPANVRLVHVAVSAPKVSKDPLVDYDKGISVAVPFSALYARMDQDSRDKFGQLYKLSPANRDAFYAFYERWPVTVRLLPFRMRRPAHRDTIELTVWNKAQEDVYALNRDIDEVTAAQKFGTIELLSEGYLSSAPDEVQDALRKLPTVPLTGGRGDEWQKGWGGVYVSPLFNHMAERVYAVIHLVQLRSEGDELARILDMDDGVFGPTRRDALEKFFQSWKGERSPVHMEVIFAQLDARHAFAKLFNVLENNYPLYYWMREAVAKHVTRTSFKNRPEVQHFIKWQFAAYLDVRQMITWEAATGDLLFVHGTLRVKPAGQAAPPAGVIGEIKPYFSEGAVVSRPNKKAMERLAPCTRKKVGELMQAMLCKGGETRTREQLIAEAVKAASDELQLDPEKDFDRVKMRTSYQVLKTRQGSEQERGFNIVWVTVRPVLRFDDEPWEATGPAKEIKLSELDAALTAIHIDKEIRAAQAFLLAEVLVLGIVVVVGTGGLVAFIELTLAITIRELIYHYTTPGADRDLEGYLTSALYGVMDTVGFRIGGALGKSAATRILGRAIEGNVLKRAVGAFVVKSLVSSTALGVTQVVEKFSDDLFHLSACRRWSSPMDYLKEFGAGFAIGLTFEFFIGPALSVGGRALVRKLASSKAGARETAEALLKELGARDIEEIAEQGAKGLEESLSKQVFAEGKAGFVKEFMEAVRTNIKEIVEHAKAVAEPKGLGAKFKAEWTSRAVKDLFEAQKVALGPRAETAIDILIRTASRDEMNQAIKTLLGAPQLRLMLHTTPKFGAQLILREAKGGFKNPGDLILTVDLVMQSPRLIALVEKDPQIGLQLLTRVFGTKPRDAAKLLEFRKALDGFLEALGKLPAEESNDILSALLRIESLQLSQAKTLAELGRETAGQMGPFMRIADGREIPYLLYVVNKHPHVDRAAIGELMRLGGKQPLRFKEVLAEIDKLLADKGKVDTKVVGELFAQSERKAEEEAAAVAHRTARKALPPAKVSESLEKDVRYGQREKDLPALHEDPARVKADLEQARIERERYNIMKDGDPARGGERRPLAFETWEEYDKFKKEFADLVAKMGKGEPIEAQGQVIGSSTSFYSGNPDKPLGHYYDRKGPGVGDVDVDLFAPDLVKKMLDAGVPTLNEKVLVGGERTIFKNTGPGGFHERFPDALDFERTWKFRLGRDVEVKLRIDLALPARPKTGPIEFFRTEPQ